MIPSPSVSRAARTAVDEQVRLRKLLNQVEAALRPTLPRTNAGPDVVAAQLDFLRGPLCAHFDEEERAGLFEQIEQQSPEHAHACGRLRAEHDALIRRLDALRAAPPLERRRTAWGNGVRTLLDELSTHEAREAEILSRALDAGTPAAD
jgi:hypothetical protein